VLRTVLALDYNHPGDRRHKLSERVRKIDLDSCLKDLIVDDSLDYSRYELSWKRCATKVAPSYSPRSQEIEVLRL